MSEKLASLFLRIGLAFVFFYAAVSALIFPENWTGFIPLFLKNLISESFLLLLFSIYEITLGVWLLSNKKIFYASVLSAVTIFFIIIFNFTVLDVVFRDVAILFMAVALAVISRGK